VIPDFEPTMVVEGIPREDDELLGRAVRRIWVGWAREQPDAKPSWLVPWEDLPERDREVDVRIGRHLANIGRLRYVRLPGDSRSTG